MRTRETKGGNRSESRQLWRGPQIILRKDQIVKSLVLKPSQFMSK